VRHGTILLCYYPVATGRWPLVYVSKKHFIAIARIIKDAKDHPQATGIDAREYIAKDLAFYLKTINPNFNRARFLEACNVNQEA
jgi:hypothetical protein